MEVGRVQTQELLVAEGANKVLLLRCQPVLGEAVIFQQCLRCIKPLYQREELTAHLE